MTRRYITAKRLRAILRRLRRAEYNAYRAFDRDYQEYRRAA